MRNQRHGCRVDFKEIEIDRGNAVLTTEHSGNFFITEHAELDQRRGQPPAINALIIERLFKLLRRDEIVFEKGFAQFCRHISH